MEQPDAPTQDALPPAGGRWANLAWIASSLVLVGLIVGIWLKVADDRSGANLTNAIITGKRPMAPMLPSEDLADAGGQPVADVPDGHVLVVNWWASWCGPCKEEAPELRRIARDYDGRATVVGINAGGQDLESDARAFAREHELDFVLVRGTKADEGAWGVSGFPETYVIGTDGRISSFVNGPVDAEILRGLLDAELAEDRT